MIAYFDCVSGVSGDMCLGALLHLGAPLSVLEEGLSRLGIPGLSVSEKIVSKHGVAARKVTVYDTGHHHHGPEAHHHGRHLSEILGLIERADLPSRVKERASRVFSRLAEAEAKVHETSVEEVHFHEVGAVDAIADVVGTAILLEHHGVDRVAASPIPLGTGFVRCAHGTIPVPAPAVVELLSGVPCYGTGIAAELATPTGAAIVSSLSGSFGPPPAMRITSVGYGAGERDLAERPNVLRVILGKEEPRYEADRVNVLTANLDDMSGERFGFVLERLMAAGALDVALVPCTMKKSRPGVVLTVLCEPGLVPVLSELIFTETTTIGMRVSESSRIKLPRRIVTVATEHGEVVAKLVTGPDGRARLTPEYESCRALALEKGLPLEVVYQAVWREEK
ncbi:MAG: nickel pincer cofactor biosynthesis protein LarC [Thermodesulfobacteriota bacterium]